MKSKKAGLFLIQFLLVVLLCANVAFANKASVSIEAPAEVTKGIRNNDSVDCRS